MKPVADNSLMLAPTYGAPVRPSDVSQYQNIQLNITYSYVHVYNHGTFETRYVLLFQVHMYMSLKLYEQCEFFTLVI